ncbi:MAG: thioredoxin domain-containing protein [Deltaproteobacteria bacterium]|nr:thioredoxin domain-containing protein [Deltaproteobacteria bacterium]
MVGQQLYSKEPRSENKNGFRRFSRSLSVPAKLFNASAIGLGFGILVWTGPLTAAEDQKENPGITSEAPAEVKLAQRKPPTDFPAVDLSGLGEMERMAFAQIVNEEICPCSCPKSFGACLQKDTKCAPAVLMGNWIAKQLREGVPGEVLAEQVTREVAAGFGAKPKKIFTSGYASKGAAKPKHTIVEFADFECAHCRAAGAMVDRLVKDHKDVKVVFKHFPLSFHQMAMPAAIATEAAAEQGRFWEMHNAVFATQNMLDENLLMGHAKALGLDVRRFEKDIKSPSLAAKVQASRAEGEKLGIESTPTFFINGRPFNLMRTIDAFELRFAMEDARATSSCK